MAMEWWRKRRSWRMRLGHHERLQPQQRRVHVALTHDQLLAVQACVQALAIQAEAEMEPDKARSLHELDRELVQVLGRMACKSVVSMLGATELVRRDDRLR